jgi:CBS domain-containing protein
MSIGDICNREVVTINAEASGIEAAKLMREHHVGDLVITEKRKGKYVPIGIVTDRDIIMDDHCAGIGSSCDFRGRHHGTQPGYHQ